MYVRLVSVNDVINKIYLPRLETTIIEANLELLEKGGNEIYLHFQLRSDCLFTGMQ